MLATILKSPQATGATFTIIETFAKIRELSRIITTLSTTKEEAAQKPLLQSPGEFWAAKDVSFELLRREFWG